MQSEASDNEYDHHSDDMSEESLEKIFFSEESDYAEEATNFEEFSEFSASTFERPQHKKATKKQLKSVYELPEARTIIYGHFIDYRKDRHCDCLSRYIASGGDDKWLVEKINAVRTYICSHVSDQFGDEDHLRFMKQMIMGKF